MNRIGITSNFCYYTEDEEIAAVGVGYFKCSNLPFVSLMLPVMGADLDFKFKSTPYTDIASTYQSHWPFFKVTLSFSHVA